MTFDGFPLVIGWELTLRCNLKCRHCASAAARARDDELTRDEAIGICDQLPALLVQEVDFTGGEPLLHPHWPDIAAHLHHLGIRTQMITNGLLVSRETLAEMQDVGLTAIGTSLDGVEATHDYIRRKPGSFGKVLGAIDAAVAADFTVTVITTVQTRNLPELPAMFDLLCGRGVKFWQIQPMFSLGRARTAAGLQLSAAEFLELGRFVRERSEAAAARGLDLSPSDPYGYYTDLDTRTVSWQGCPAGRAACGITSNGKIKGCLSLPDHLIEGDLRQRDLWDIWFDPGAFSYTRRFSAHDLGSFCRGCDKADQCMGGCSAMSCGNTGSFHNDPLCFYRILHRGADHGQRPESATVG